jgi:LemA protein
LPNLLTARLFDFQVKPNFTVTNEQTIAVPPTVDFGPDSPPAPSAPPSPGPGAPAPK